MAALRDQHGRDADQHRGQPAFRLLPGRPAVSDVTAPSPVASGAAAPLPTVTAEPRRRRLAPKRSWIAKGLLLAVLVLLAILFLYPLEWLVAASFKPRGDTFDNRFLPATWAWNF